MRILDVKDTEFKPYGKIIEGYDFEPFMTALADKTPLPEGCEYVPEEPALQNLPEAAALGDALFGGIPVQFGWCNGRKRKLNCLEYHRSSEMLLGTEDVILLLAQEADITDGRLDTSTVKAFRAPRGVMVELYATTLHYAPCHIDPKKGFRNIVILPKGTNTEKPSIMQASPEDRMLLARNKWLLAHPESDEAGSGAYVGLTGWNIDISHDIEASCIAACATVS